MLNKTQFEALVQIMGAGRMSEPMRAALRDFFCIERPDAQKVIAQRHGVSPNGLNQRITLARKNINLACALVTGLENT